MIIPTIKEIVARNISNFEARLGQTVPLAEKSFVRVVSVVLSMIEAGLYKFGAERSRQNLALTASSSGLIDIGDNYGVYRHPAEPAKLTVSIPAEDGAVIPTTVRLIGAANGVSYILLSEGLGAAGFVVVPVQAEEVGEIGNLKVGDTLFLDRPVIGSESQGIVESVTALGVEQEDIEDFRQRVLVYERAVGGGGNAYDYKRWAEETPGVRRAFPYSGRPYGSTLQSFPRHRTVYVESSSGTGVPDQVLLDSVRTTITTDLVTGRSRQSLGSTDETLFVEPVSRVSFSVNVASVVVDPSVRSAAEAAVETALTGYFSRVAPFLVGVDIESDRMDTITTLTLSAVVQSALSGYGGSAAAVTFGPEGGGTIGSYHLNPGVLAKLSDGGVRFV